MCLEGLLTSMEISGGTFSLYSLLCRHAKVGLLPSDESSDEIMHYETGSSSPSKKNSRARRAIKNNKISHYMMLLLALFGSCMMIGDGVLTPALSGLLIYMIFTK